MKKIVLLALTAATLAGAQTNSPCLSWNGPWPGHLNGKALDANSLPTSRCMTDAEIGQLIDLGRSYHNPEALWRDEFHGYMQYHFKWVRNATGDGFALNSFFTNSSVRVLTDAWRVASGALVARNQMRDFTIEDARKLASRDLVASVSGEDRGLFQNLTNGMHVVVKLDGGKIIQPETESASAGAQMSNWSSLVQHSNASAQFAFALPDGYEPDLKIVFIAGNGKTHHLPIDLRRLR